MVAALSTPDLGLVARQAGSVCRANEACATERTGGGLCLDSLQIQRIGGMIKGLVDPSPSKTDGWAENEMTKRVGMTQELGTGILTRRIKKH